MTKMDWERARRRAPERDFRSERLERAADRILNHQKTRITSVASTEKRPRNSRRYGVPWLDGWLDAYRCRE